MKIRKFNELIDSSKLRNISKMNQSNDGTRTLFESIVAYEVLKALENWASLKLENYVLIGGLALSFYVKPRMTQDIDMLFLTKEDIPKVLPNFKRTRPGAFQHNNTHVEVEVVVPQSINVDIKIVQKVFETSVISNDVRVASPSGIIALKLFRFSRQDQADIESLILECDDIDLSPFDLPERELERYNSIYLDIN